jgi:hypothetical protein
VFFRKIRFFPKRLSGKEKAERVVMYTSKCFSKKFVLFPKRLGEKEKARGRVV